MTWLNSIFGSKQKKWQDKSEKKYPKFQAEPWTIDNISFQENTLIISGWALPPIDNTAVNFSINGHNFDVLDYPIIRTEVGEKFSRRLNSSNCGFFAKYTGTIENPLFRNGYAILKCSYDGHPEPFDFQRCWYFKDPHLNVNLPDADRRFRVIGSYNENNFTMGGFTDFKRIEELLKIKFKKNYHDFTSILDWGCGCGRVCRYFSDMPEINFSGADIDFDNISYCKEHLQQDAFYHIPLHPPTSFDNNTFDLIYGISVFTHLKEDTQFEWLQELNRITRPDGIVLVSIHGQTAFDYAQINDESYFTILNRIAQEGIVVTSNNNQIDNVIDDKNYYVNVAHSWDYIRREWTKYFEVIDIIPGMVYTHDVVILKKRSDVKLSNLFSNINRSLNKNYKK
jgi:2-polyprenyl-3-methyl-5-hydroxy-6-metoxy-1,4-benzoquinol methylase